MCQLWNRRWFFDNPPLKSDDLRNMACKCAAFIRHDFKAPEEFEQVLTAGHCVHLRFRFHLKILEDTQSRASRFDRFDPCFLYFSVRQDGGFGSHISDLFSRAG